MTFDPIAIVFYVLLIDSVIANALAWGAEGWYVKHFRLMSRWLPITKGWTACYLALVLWIGYLTFY